MVVSREEDMHLILLATETMSFTVKLVRGEALAGYHIDTSSLFQELVVTSLSTVRVHDYSIRLTSDLDFEIMVAVGHKPLDYLLRHTVQSHSTTWLRKVVMGMVQRVTVNGLQLFCLCGVFLCLGAILRVCSW